jgi:hypothetical protein
VRQVVGFAVQAGNSELIRDGQEGMIGSAFRSAFDTPSSVPSAALMMIDDVVFSGMYVTDATRPQ